ncbi:5776_t:CDS:2, partial [Entrophospora sp. SA101]
DRSKFIEGDMVILRDQSSLSLSKNNHAPRTILIGPLNKNGKHDTHKGIIYHDSIIGNPPRSRILTHTNKLFTIHFPTLDEYILMYRRHTTPIYPKDANTIIGLLDLHPYSKILESGTGNGFLTLYLARALYPTGTIHTIDINLDYTKKAQKNIRNFSRGLYYDIINFSTGSCSEILKIADDGSKKEASSEALPIPPLSFSSSASPLSPLEIYDGVVLDMPEPWNDLPTIVKQLKIDCFIICYLPNMTQVLNLVKSIKIRSNNERIVKHLINNNNMIPEKALAYICRPSHTPTNHTAFLVQLKKISS